MTKDLDTMKQALELLRPLVISDLRTNIVWLSHIRHTVGYLKDAIKAYENNPTKKMIKDRFNSSNIQKGEDSPEGLFTTFPSGDFIIKDKEVENGIANKRR